MEQDELSNFIDGVINNNLEPKVNEVVVGAINVKIIDYLNSRNIILIIIYFFNFSSVCPI